MAWKTGGEERLRQEPLQFPCGKLSLEGLCYLPDGKGAFPAVVVCHPHPLYGGSMDNNVVHSISAALVEKSIVALMFNFRGVGGSQGRFGAGVAEQEDIICALDWIEARPEVAKKKIGLAGYSFGAMVALPVAISDNRVEAVALISMPPGPEQVSQLKICYTPKLLISGSNDTVVPLKRAQLMAREAAEPKQSEIINDADHIWWGYEEVLAEKVSDFFIKKL